ncbi:permease of the drug/metabolite transporter superfamily [Lachnospiraceae bacterium KM106-2]|nr:permease of the drug/metabolite transporter superfamily [Lachnospiraceae bacterium KM106-2]
MKKAQIGNLILVLAAFIWGLAFVAQSVGMRYVGAFTFLMARSYLGGCFLIPCIALFSGNKKVKSRKSLYVGGVLCGTILFAASILQQIGIKYTSVGKSGFLTTLYIILVPILSIVLHKKPSKRVWVAVGVALAGLYLLCMKGSFHLDAGDSLILMSAFCFAIHILLIDYFSPRTDPVRLSCIQFFVCGIFSTGPSLFIESPTVSNLMDAWMPIVYAGVLSSGVAYTLQIIGQKYTDATKASLIMSLESVFSVLGGWVILHQYLSARELLGCVCVFAAIVIVQLPERSKKIETGQLDEN